MAIILSHDNDQSTKPAPKLWQKYVTNGILKRNVGLHELAYIANYSTKKDKTVKNVCLFILSKINTVQRFMSITLTTKHHEPLLYHGKPMIIEEDSMKIV